MNHRIERDRDTALDMIEETIDAALADARGLDARTLTRLSVEIEDYLGVGSCLSRWRVIRRKPKRLRRGRVIVAIDFEAFKQRCDSFPLPAPVEPDLDSLRALFEWAVNEVRRYHESVKAPVEESDIYDVLLFAACVKKCLDTWLELLERKYGEPGPPDA